MVMHVDTIGKVLVDELGQIIKRVIVNKVDGCIMNIGYKFYLEFSFGNTRTQRRLLTRRTMII